MPKPKLPSNLPTAPIPSSHIIPPSPQLSRHLGRLSKPSLLKLLLEWLNSPQCEPDLSPTTEELDDDETAEDAFMEDVVEQYRLIKNRKGMVERVFEREW